MNLFYIVIVCFAALLLLSMIAGSIKALYVKIFRNRHNKAEDCDTYYEEQRPETASAPKEEPREYEHSAFAHHNTRANDGAQEMSREERELSNIDEMRRMLRGMGCQPKPADDGNLAVAYQGENFLIQPNGGYLRIWDLNWLSSKATDDDFLLLKDAANYANFSFGPTIVMHAPDEDGNIYVSSRMDIFLMPGLEENQAYVESILNSFFSIKHITHREYMRLKEDPRDRTLDTNPIGFDTASLADPSSPQAN